MAKNKNILVDMERPTGWKGWRYTFLVKFCMGIARLLWFMRTDGAENIPSEGAVIVIANHPTYLDPPTLIGNMIYYANRDIHIMAWDKLFTIPVVAWFCRTYLAYPVDRENPGRGPYMTILHVLKNGGMAGIFPEGRRSSTPTMHEWKPGALRAAFSTKATILPVSLKTMPEVWPRGRKIFKPFRQHHVVIHKPITFEEYTRDKPDDMKDREWQDVVAKQVQEIIRAPIRARYENFEANRQRAREAQDPTLQRMENADGRTPRAKSPRVQSRPAARANALAQITR